MFTRMTRYAHIFAAVLALAPATARADCFGLNILDLMPLAERAELTAAADAVPYPSGNFWQAQKGDARITIIGTYHLDDPRHESALAHFTPVIGQAMALLVEAGPEETKALTDQMAKDPSLMTITEGPTLLETLPPDTWEDLSAAMRARGVPPFMTAKFRPWYITVMLAMPPCMLQGMKDDPKGLDGLLIDAALAADVPIKALEPYDTVFTIFGSLTPQEEVEMIQQSLAMEDVITDFSVTLADTYFDGSSRLMWELMRYESYKMPGFSREKVDGDLARMEDLLMISRNRSWIPVIDAAAAEGPLVMAFGALHLSGEEGVLNLLAQDGWVISALDIAGTLP